MQTRLVSQVSIKTKMLNCRLSGNHRSIGITRSFSNCSKESSKLAKSFCHAMVVLTGLGVDVIEVGRTAQVISSHHSVNALIPMADPILIGTLQQPLIQM